MTGDNFWADAEIISSYSRAQAIEDGVLVDVSTMAPEAGFRYPVALTRTVWEDCVAWDGPAIQDEAGRLWDVLWMTMQTIRRRASHDRVEVQLLRVPRGESRARLVKLVAVCGPGDQAEPVITIQFPGED